MKQISRGDVLGVVGGMGPLASAEFLKTIYEVGIGSREQESPVVILYSDPTFPDRTDAFLEGRADVLLAQLSAMLDALGRIGASKVVMCCMTIHYLLPRLDEQRRRRLVSLLDIIFEEVIERRQEHLLICSTGTRRLRLFEQHPLWERARSYLVLPDEDDQRLIHSEIIYRIKMSPDISRFIPVFESLLDKYKVSNFVAGCSEIHLLAKHYLFSQVGAKHYNCIDPLTLIASRLAETAS